MNSTLIAQILQQVEREPFVYTYYDEIDKVAHEYGLNSVYDAELVFVDRMVEYLIQELPPGAALVITADRGGSMSAPGDHFQPGVMGCVDLQSG